MATKLTIDWGPAGFLKGIQRAGAIILYHIATDATIIAGAEFFHIIGKLQINHPEYSVFLMAIIAGGNSVFGFLKHWLFTHTPEGDTLHVQTAVTDTEFPVDDPEATPVV